MEEFLEYLNKQTSLSPRTAKTYAKILHAFHSRRDPTIEAMNEEIKIYPLTKYAFKFWLTWQGRADEIPKLLKGRILPAKREGVYLNSEELLRIINAVEDPRYKVIATIQYATGIRASDVLKIRKERIRILPSGGLRIRVIGKGEKERIVFMPQAYVNIVLEFISPFHDYSFPFTTNGTCTTLDIETTYNYYWRAIKQAAIKAGFPKFASHDWRRNLINDVFERTKDLRKAQVAAGHSRADTTIRYINKKVQEKEYRELINDIRG